MRIPILSEESSKSLLTEIVNNKGEQVYQKILELSESNPVMYDIIRHLASLFPTKETYDNAILSMVALICIVESELERTELENTIFEREKK